MDHAPRMPSGRAVRYAARSKSRAVRHSSISPKPRSPKSVENAHSGHSDSPYASTPISSARAWVQQAPPIAILTLSRSPASVMRSTHLPDASTMVVRSAESPTSVAPVSRASLHDCLSRHVDAQVDDLVTEAASIIPTTPLPYVVYVARTVARMTGPCSAPRPAACGPEAPPWPSPPPRPRE